MTQTFNQIEVGGFNGDNNNFGVTNGSNAQIFVSSDKVKDEDASTLAFEISEKIQNEMTYPGQVKVTVIREMRATSIAR